MLAIILDLRIVVESFLKQPDVLGDDVEG